MKILRITPHYYFEAHNWPSRFDPMGGMQVQITNLSEWLAKKGIEQDVLTTGMPGVPRIVNSLENLTVHSVRTMTLPVKSKYTGTLFLDQSWFLGALKWIIKNGRNRKYDAIHVHASGVVWPLLAASFAQKYLNKPLFLSIHCSRNFTYHPMNSWDKWIHSRVKSYELKAMQQSDKVILLTKKRMDSYEKVLQNNSNLLEVGDCIAPHHLQHPIDCPNCRLLREGLGSYRNVVFLGRIAHEKGWHAFLNVAKELASRLDNLRFIVCGDGPQRKQMEEEIAKCGLQHQFRITGFISNKTVSCYLQQAHVMVLPSQHEEFGGSLLEATVAGVPIIATCNGGPADIFVNGKTGILKDPKDIAGMAEEAYRILSDPMAGNELLRNASREVVPRFLPDRVYANYVELYGKYNQK
ncbi:glycosyltransferase family 4 protein [Paenibacillus sp. KS-LC4]|uniref:glycosyltransferase family 4 protein n=1 Tax=Paenibacillus sp. KS-LC4 TaxID=2979727 RepID=UPI0030D08668